MVRKLLLSFYDYLCFQCLKSLKIRQKFDTKVLFIQNYDIQTIKILFFENFRERKISDKIEMKKNGNCVKYTKVLYKFHILNAKNANIFTYSQFLDFFEQNVILTFEIWLEKRLEIRNLKFYALLF